MSDRAAVERELTVRGFIPHDGSALDRAAEQVWRDWWSNRPPLAVEEALARAERLMAAPRPDREHNGAEYEVLGVRERFPAWVRPADLVLGDTTYFPCHHTLPEMAAYATTWTMEQAAWELSEDLWWLLEERPGGWAGAVTTNGRHRAFVAAVAQVPLVPVAGLDVSPTTGLPFELLLSSRGYGMRRLREARNTLEQLAKLGLCATPDQRWALEWVDPVFPWIVAGTRAGVRAKLEVFEARFGPAEVPEAIRHWDEPGRRRAAARWFARRA